MSGANEEREGSLQQRCEALQDDFFENRSLIIASNRGPVSFEMEEVGELEYERGAGGLVTALSGLIQRVDATWIATARTEGDAAWGQGTVDFDGGEVEVQFLSPDQDAYYSYYNVIANPLLWFLQHSMWDVPRAPIIHRATWKAWEDGYVAVNRLFAEAIAERVQKADRLPLVMLQDYHLYLAADHLREILGEDEHPPVLHFTHIPWPGAEYWAILPPEMRRAILIGLCAADVLGFQTRNDAVNFVRTCQAHLPSAVVDLETLRVAYEGHTAHVRDFPISIDVEALRETARSPSVMAYREEFEELIGDRQLMLRVDRLEPSKNIIRGFFALEELFELHPEHLEEVQFVAILVPSRLGVEEYRDYLDDVMGAAGRVNANYGTSDWEPVRIIVGDNYPRAVAALQLYDILLVNPIADGMNLVAKEGVVVNERDGVLVLSEKAGARQQLGEGALVISPCDVFATGEALHRGLTMAEGERGERAELLRRTVMKSDVTDWLCEQLEVVVKLKEVIS
jgi:trehalose 6-phosphate synthase